MFRQIPNINLNEQKPPNPGSHAHLKTNMYYFIIFHIIHNIKQSIVVVQLSVTPNYTLSIVILYYIDVPIYISSTSVKIFYTLNNTQRVQ